MWKSPSCGLAPDAERRAHGSWGPLCGALLLLCSAVPALAQGARSAGGESFVAAAGLSRYALGDTALARIRGGFAAANGINFSFGFQQITSINGTVIQSILVPELSKIPSTIPVFVVGGAVSIGSGPAQVSLSKPSTGPSATPPAAVTVATQSGATRSDTVANHLVQQNNGAPEQQTSAAPSGAKEYAVLRSDPSIAVSTVLPGPGGGAGTSVHTTLGTTGVLSSIDNVLNNQVIQQATTMNISVSGLAESVAAAQAMESVVRAAAQGFNLP